MMNHDHEHDLEAKKSMRPKIERNTTYWLDMEQYSNDPAFWERAETEFQSSPLREDESNQGGWARREFLKLMGASIAMASAGCVRRPVQKIVPYNTQPEEVTLGIPNFYTSSYFDGTEGLGVLIKTREGRPIKIESNPKHGFNMGGLSARSQASLLSLYDPERLQGPKHNLFNEKKTNKESVGAKWADIDKKVVEQLNKGEVYILTGNLASPSTKSIIKEFSQGFGAKHVVYEALSQNEIIEGQKACYGEASVPQYRFDKAKMIVSIDADFLGSWMTPTAFTRQFAMGRKDIQNMSRLVAFDSSYSLTGANADIRIKIKPSLQLVAAMGLLHELVVKKGVSSYASNESLKSKLSSYASAAADLGIEPALLSAIADDLWKNKEKALVVAGGLAAQTENALALQVAVNLLNSILESDGNTVIGGASTCLAASDEGVLALIKDLNAGKVGTLIIHGVNPAYTLPDSLGFSTALKKAKMIIYTGDRIDETGRFADYILPDHHALENWGDAEFTAGVYTVSQPAIRPMYDTRAFQTSLMTWAFMANKGPQRLRDYEAYYDYLRVFWKEDVMPKVEPGKNFEEFWQSVLQSGSVGQQKSKGARSFHSDALSALKTKPSGNDLELVLYSTVQLGDGRLANIGWLHELPDPVTKIVWDNYAMISLGTAKKLGLLGSDEKSMMDYQRKVPVVEVVVGSRKVKLPAHIQPGLHDGVVAIAVGYGRTDAGKVGNGIGYNAYDLAEAKGDALVFSGAKVTLNKTSERYPIACTQGHHAMEGRQLVVEATLAEYLKKKDANIHKHHTWSIWSGHQYNGHKWGLAVDLNSCTGCSACVTACQSENNVTVVGKKYIIQGREMHWIRIDRYYVGTPENAEVVFQPVMCQHCDNAPCETVCPVMATVHSDEGLNDMAYNRCVGTRYCANNCPYKVRRFNWFNYAKLIEKPMHLALNPSVGVRVRGVMEKCSFCVQRIHEGKQVARNEGRALKDGDVKTACQTACPTEAITFGDINDAESALGKIFKSEPRAYALLEEWNAAPSVRYMSKIRNNGKEILGRDSHSKQQGEHS